jgi:hypothetical protein
MGITGVAASAGAIMDRMTDSVRQAPTAADADPATPPLVTLDIVARRFIVSGLPRSIRTLQRYCANGTLTCVKEATETGDTYFVAETSIGTAITALKQLHAAKAGLRQGPPHDSVPDGPWRTMAAPDAPSPAPDLLDDHDRPSPAPSDSAAAEPALRPAATGRDMSDTVALLTERLAEKDEEIAFLREELIDRRGQIKDMKSIIDGQNQLLDTIQRNVAPIFKALAATVQSGRSSLATHMAHATREDADAQEGHTGELTHADRAGEAFDQDQPSTDEIQHL